MSTEPLESPFVCTVVPPAKNVLDAIGNTPLIQLSRYLDVADVTLFAKLEASNPGGSAKDRPAHEMIRQAIERGEIDHNTTVIESSSGNMGIGLAQVCRYYGMRFICVVDPRAQHQNIEIMQALGAEIDLVDQPLEGDFLAARLARVCYLLETTPDSYWPNQYSNPANPLSHRIGTVREIDEALGGHLDYLFVATSSTGAAQGCRDFLRSMNRSTQVVAVDSAGSVLFGGTAGTRMIPGLGAGRVPPLARNQTFDHIARVSDLDCVVGCRRMAHREAMLVGGSAGGVLETVRRMQDQLSGKACAAILHDSGTRYLQTIFNDEWVTDRLGCDPETIRQRAGITNAMEKKAVML
ncbi:2,3-diaminopropionate biosynthesis protein SbnA [Novipirellula sp. SH528]|uniref:2,3-diaminopropionate biosynthesis protein SbnA n=1 Tax=Novipirellula sp. SH528 TaxID=3454466 RepID=UPI003F9FDB92